MKRTTRLISVFLILATLFASVCVLPLHADDPDQTQTGNTVTTQKKTQKIVTVVYDDSGSMLTTIGDGTSATRADYALYSIKMLMSLLGEGDVLQIVPMNKSPVTYTLLGDGRQKQIDDIVASGVFTPSGSTPITSVDDALAQLAASGLKDADNLTTQDENKDFWLFVLTDGQFNYANNAVVKEENTPTEMRNRIDKYPALKTIYFAFSNAAIDLRGTSFESELSVAYKAQNGNELVRGMQDIASQLSGRYNYTDFTIDGDKNATSGSSVVINFNNSAFPIKNLSVLALNCDATITSVEYQPKGGVKEDLSGSVKQSCVISPGRIPGIKSGCSAVINGNPHFSGGSLTIRFSKPVSKEYLSIFAEPALILSPTFKVQDKNGSFVPVDTDYITGGKVVKGQKLMVGYVCTTGDGGVIDVADAFGSEVKASVTHAGTTKPIPKGAAETDITLTEGPNSITITVNIEGVNYRMYTTVNCNVLADQSSYRVTAEHDPDQFSKKGSSTASYKVYVNNVEKTPTQLKAEGFTWYVEITTPDGDVRRIENPEKNGRIVCDIGSKTGSFGDYTVYFRVISTLGWRMDETKYYYSAEIDGLEIRSDTPDTLDKGATQTNVDFTVHNGGEQLDKKILGNYDLKLKVITYDKSEIELTPKIAEDGRITATVPLDPSVYGEYKTCLTLTLKGGGDVERTHTHTLKIYPKSVVISGEHPDAFENGKTETSAKYWIKLDGKLLTKADLEKYDWTLRTYAPGGASEYANTVTVADDGTISLSYDVAGAQYGAYESVLEIVFSDSYKETYKNAVKNIPESVSLVLVGDASMSLTQHQLTENGKGFRFELYSGELPLVFNNGISTYRVIVNGKDVTDYADINGNILTYAPHADHFGGTLPLGKYSVLVTVDSAQFSGVSASASFEVLKTVYEIKSLPGGNKRVERFDLKDMDVALRFVVLRDGVPLPLDELKAAYESGAIKVKDVKGTFTWEFWFPCGREITVTEYNGEPVIEFRVVRDIGFLGLDKVMAMFFFTGDKPVSVSYQDASATDSVRIERGAVWVYLLIWFIIFLIIHLILFGIGFINGKCKNLPSGVFISVALTGREGREQEFNIDKKVNLSFADKWSWHLGRLFLYGCFKKKKLWYHQPEIRYAAYSATLGYDDEGSLGLMFKADGIYKADMASNRTQARTLFLAYKDALASYDGKHARPEMERNLMVRELRDLFRPRRGEASVQPTDFLTRYDGPYAEMNEKTRAILSVMIFIEKN